VREVAPCELSLLIRYRSVALDSGRLSPRLQAEGRLGRLRIEIDYIEQGAILDEGNIEGTTRRR
jgi:hypothetical protein